MQPSIIVLSGPSGVGKNTILDGVLAKQIPGIITITKWTTRQPRPGETDGEEFQFLTTQEFQQKITEGKLAEWNEYAGNLYGLPKKSVEEALAHGKSPLVILDYHGARAMRESFPNSTLLIFIAAPLEFIRQRMEKRGTDKIDERLAIAKEELGEQSWFDEVVINPEGHPEQAIATIANLLESK